MKKKILIKILVLVLIIAIITGFCVHRNYVQTKNEDIEENFLVEENEIFDDKEMSFTGLDDENLQNYMIENLYASLNSNFSNDDYTVESITTTYISKESIEELTYNSKSNVYFGFTLDELAQQFNGKKFVFEVGENNETVVSEFEEYNDTYIKMIKNVATGTGVILICATVSVATGGTTSIVFAASAKTATEFAVSSFALSSMMSSAIEYYQTGDIQKSLEKGVLDGTESFKWGAILGGITGGTSEAITQIKASKEIKTMTPGQLGARAEARAQKKYGGKDQVSYLDGKEVPMSTVGATRPDLVREVNGKLEAVEVKNYNLDAYWSRQGLYDELKRQVTNRTNHLPEGTTQRIVLDVQGRNYTNDRIKEVITRIKNACKDVYPNIPVDVMT